MFRSTFAMLALVAVAGCSTSARMDNPFVGGKSDNAMLAAYAANSRFPTSQPTGELKATVVVDSSNRIKIINPADTPISDARVWINREFVTHVVSIPAHSAVDLPRSIFYNGQGQSLASIKTGPLVVQIENRDGLYNLQGPAWD